MSYEIVSENERVYFDTSMWVAPMLDTSSYNTGYMFAQDKFDELKNNAFHVYVSDLVLMESACVIRRKTAEHEKNTTMSLKSLEDKIKTKVERFYQKIEKNQRAGMITVENPKDSLDWFLQQSHSVSSRPQRDTLIYRSGNTPYRYVGTGFLDFQHAIIATTLKCAYFYTLDKGFNKLKLMPEFKTLAIVTP